MLKKKITKDLNKYLDGLILSPKIKGSLKAKYVSGKNNFCTLKKRIKIIAKINSIINSNTFPP